MNKVIVKVIDERGTGIPDLLVVLYDGDPAQQQSPNFPAENLTGFWSQLQGDRLGSGLTNQEGLYEFTFEDSEFLIEDQELRPDFLLFVMAPETTTGQENNLPVASPPQSQIIHFSNVPRVNAGRAESYIVKLTETQLSRFQIVVPGTELEVVDPQEAAQQYLAARQATQIFHNEVRNQLSEEMQQRFDHRRQRRTQIKEAVKNLSSVSQSQRESAYFVMHEATEAAVRDSHLAARAAGLSHIEAYRAGAEARVPLILIRNAEDLVIAGITDLPASPAERREITDEVFCALMHPSGGGYDLTRVRTLLEAIRDAARDSEEPGETPPTGSEPPGDDAGGSIDIEAEIQKRVLGQLSDLATFDASGAKEKDPLVRLKESLTSLQLSAGPANVTAYHDFYSLQVAFKHVWTEAFDSSVKRVVEWLYDEFVAWHEEYGLRAPAITEIYEASHVTAFIEDLDYTTAVGYLSLPRTVTVMFPEAKDRWSLLDLDQQTTLEQISRGEGDWATKSRDERREEGKLILNQPAGARNRLARLLAEVGKYLSEPYAFHYFQPNSVNYGILATYRQEWIPEPYQVGDLISTISLAPGETRKFTKKELVKRTRAIKEAEKAISSRRGESSQTRRAETEIMEKAAVNSNFKLTAQGSFSFGLGSISTTTDFALNQANESASTKKDFREAVLKASYEYKNERALEVSTTDELTAEVTTSGELKNPNNELTVTYLLYELERQYTVAERIHRLTPVILVAQDVPGPHEITEAWLLKQEWILRRVLLDDSFHDALDHLTQAFAGDELSLRVKQENWETQKELVASLEAARESHRLARDALRDILIRTEEARGRVEAAEESEGFFESIGDFLTGDPEEFDIANFEAKLKALQTESDFLNKKIQDIDDRLIRAEEALNQATRAYTDALEAQTNRRVAIDQLRIHVKDNIIYYMQAIWDHEPPDQRFFRLYDKRVFVPRHGSVRLTIRRADPATDGTGALPGTEVDGEAYVIEAESLPIPDLSEHNIRPLVEIADLDKPLGYKGNYIIFPLKGCTFITNYMMREYVDDYFGIRDPDTLAEFTSEELLRYTESVRGDLTDAERDALDRLIIRRLMSPRRESDLIVVPTGQLYMEALLGDQPLLEPFKMAHRGYDAAKARAELREQELENLRLAARLLQEEPLLDDPEVDKKVVVNGQADVHVDIE